MGPFSPNECDALWHYLGKVAQERNHPARVISLASSDNQGRAQVRSVILREVEPWQMTVYTDSRSPKVAQLRADPRVQLLVWDAQKRWQLRLTAEAEVITDARAESLWARIKGSAAASDYLAPQAPGEIVDTAAPPRSEPAIAILRFAVSEVDWLVLDSTGHRRQRLTHDGVQALVP